MSDYMIRATAANGQIRAFAATTRDLTEYARNAHNTSPVVTAALGRTMTAAVMMGSMLKGDKELLTVKIQGDGPIGSLTVTADSHGHVKGYAQNPVVLIQANSIGKLDVAGAIGKGVLSVIKDIGLKDPYVGQTDLVSGEIAEDLTYYFAVSEQTPSSVGLGVLMNKDNTVRQAGGFIIQLMPDASEETISALEKRLAKVGKRTAQAALKIACDMVDEGMITTDEALMMVEPKQLDSLLHPMFDADELKKAEPIASALPASPGAACGQIVFSAEEAIQEASRNHKVILVRLETSPEDIEGMHVSQGILTVRGGMTSHAAVVARGMGACCVSGCGDIKMHDDEGYFEIDGVKYHRGDWISLDGSTGNIYGSAIKTVPASISGDFERFMNWADERRTLKVRTNADTPHDAKQAHEFGAQGIGLVRTEHMFFEGDRIKAVREMIVSKTAAQRRVALEKILPMQRSDFEGIYEAMEGLPVTIRYLDPPLHEFLPTNSYDITQLAKDMHIGLDELKSVISSLHEFNPMMGHRGCRLAISYPEIAEMQTTAVIQAALAVNERHPDWKIEPEIMIPLVGDVAELRYVKKVVCEVADKLIQESEFDMKYHVGTMIEIPRAALLADEIAKEAEFFSFGTNDLTQMTFGFSRDDAGGFLQDYYDKKIFESDPFAHLDQRGVGKLVKMATELGRSTRPNIKLGICGEHGGDPASIEFCHRVGLNYVSCSPYRVPIARLAAAQAAIKFDK